MAKYSGGTRVGGAGARGGMSQRASELADKYLGNVSDPTLKKSLAEGMAAFEKEFGIPVFGNNRPGQGELNVLVSDLGKTTYGSINGAGFLTINSRFESGKMEMEHAKHTIIHELAHGIDKTIAWNAQTSVWYEGKWVLKDANRGFNRKLTAAYKTFKKKYGSGQTKQIGPYALKNKNEFFAEAIAAHMTGKQNSYTTFAYNLAKSMTGK